MKHFINDRSDIVTEALEVAAPYGEAFRPKIRVCDTMGLGQGIFLDDGKGHFSAVIRPGDPLPGGTLDWSQTPWINDRGDIVGTFLDPAGLTHGFLRHKTMQMFGQES